MAIYRCEAKIITRGEGHSAVAAAAYRTGTKIRDERSNQVHDYSSRTPGIIESVILKPDNAPEWANQTATLWNEVERCEKRKDSQLAREFILAVPKELSSKEQFDCAVSWAKKELVSQGMIVEVALHHPKDGKNPHCHLLCTMRKIEEDKFSAKKPREWNDVGLLVHWRETWGNAVNGALEKAGRPERVDHRSLKDQGIDRIPQPKIGTTQTAMKRRGVLWDSPAFKKLREVKLFNEALSLMKSIKSLGEVKQHGLGGKWWQAAPFLENARNRARNVFKSTWQRLAKAPQPGKGKDGFEPSR